MTISETVKWFNSIFDINKSGIQTKRDFCIGFTSDIEHVKKNNDAINLLGTTKCDSLKVAQELIDSMRDEGYETPQEQLELKTLPVFIYMYKRPNN